MLKAYRSSIFFPWSISIHPSLPGMLAKLCQAHLPLLLKRAPSWLLWNGSLLFLFVNCQHEAGTNHQRDLLLWKCQVIASLQTSSGLTSFIPSNSFLSLWASYEESVASSWGLFLLCVIDVFFSDGFFNCCVCRISSWVQVRIKPNSA